MSVQLIVYPLKETTTTTTVSAAGQEFLSDGQTFSTLNLASQYTYTSWSGTVTSGVQSWLLVGGAAYPSVPNIWYSSRKVGASTPDYPQQISSEAVFQTTGSSIATVGWGSIYQRMIGLTPGTTYRVTIGTHPTTTGPMGTYATVIITDGSSGIPVSYVAGSSANGVFPSPFTMTGVDEVFEFTATVSDHTVFINVIDQNPGVTTTNIRFMSVQSQGTATVTTSGFSADLQRQEMLDLYEDESIPLTLSVDDFKDVASKTPSI